MAEEVAEEYLSSLMDLTVNSKPLINMLTMLAEENKVYAEAIVQAIESHIQKVHNPPWFLILAMMVCDNEYDMASLIWAFF